jgi:KipI family sensor histidine kinase inhibitor
VRLLPAGPRALLVEVAGLQEVAALQAEVQRRRADGWAPSLADVVPGACTLLLDGLDDIAATARELRDWTVAPVVAGEGPMVRIECVYDGPDLDDVARSWGVSPEAVATEHAAYLAGLSDNRSVPRRDNPRTRVPGGSVAVAGVYSGVYPRESPGGWQLIGRTEAVLWDDARDSPALLVPGHRVSFVDVT